MSLARGGIDYARLALHRVLWQTWPLQKARAIVPEIGGLVMLQ